MAGAAWGVAAATLVLSTGCGGYMARRLAQAPNTYPRWLAPEAPVVLQYAEPYLTNWAAHFVEVGTPPARLRYRIIGPGDYAVSTQMTNWNDEGRQRFRFTLRASVPNDPDASASDRACGARSERREALATVVLLHAYGLDQSTLAPWALHLGSRGMRCILVDLRGHGKSSGRRITFGPQEVRDLVQFWDALSARDCGAGPLAVIGYSYGAALALRWKANDPRVGAVIAIAPYPELAPAVLNVRRAYAPCLPEACVRAGLKRLPALLRVAPSDLDTSAVLAHHPVDALFIAGDQDVITPVTDVQRLAAQAGPASRCVIVPGATHESLPLHLDALEQAVSEWLNAATASD